MIDRVTFAETTYLDAPMRFEAGTPHIVGAVGLHAAIDWVERPDARRRSTRTNARSSPNAAQRFRASAA